MNNMKATELRIGNLIDYERTTHIVCGLREDMIESWWFKDGKAVIEYLSNDSSGVEVENPYFDSNSNYKPILLTEEWLYKFGFENIDKSDNDYITYTDPNHDYYLQIDVRKKDGKYAILDNSFDDLRDFSMVDISYVHQLQNLYFALTGEELILNKIETYSIPIYENGIKTEWSVDGVVGDEKYQQLIEMSPEGKLPIIINTKTKK
jgi:hypothetical protein